MALLLALGVSACGRIGYDVLGAGAPAEDAGSSPSDRDASTSSKGGAGGAIIGAGGTANSGGVPGTGGGSPGGAAQSGGTSGSGAAAGGGSGGASGSGGSLLVSDASASGGATSGVDAGTGGTGGSLDASSPIGKPALDCAGGASLSGSWSFDSGSQGFSLLTTAGMTATLVFDPVIGDLAAGALKLDVTAPGPTQTAWAQLDSAIGNLGGRTATAALWLDGEGVVAAKLFVQTGGNSAWGDGGALFLTPHAWTCVSLVLDSPSYETGGYDAKAVSRLGVELVTALPTRVYLDDFAY